MDKQINDRKIFFYLAVPWTIKEGEAMVVSNVGAIKETQFIADSVLKWVEFFENNFHKIIRTNK